MYIRNYVCMIFQVKDQECFGHCTSGSNSERRVSFVYCILFHVTRLCKPVIESAWCKYNFHVGGNHYPVVEECDYEGMISSFTLWKKEVHYCSRLLLLQNEKCI
jgi:hypothetical protein